MKYPALKDTVRIQRHAYACGVYALHYPEVAYVPPDHAFVLSLCDGITVPGVIERCFAAAYGLDAGAAAEYVERVYQRFWYALDFLPEPRAVRMRYRMQDFAYKPVAQRQGERFAVPERATLQITNRCNFECVYCFNSSGPSAREGLPTDAWLQALEELAEMRVPCVEITGGEPFLHSGIDAVLARLQSWDALVYLYTNGLLLNASRIEQLACMPNLCTQVSLDTVDEAIFDRVTKSAKALPGVIANIARLVRQGGTVRVKCLLLPETIGGVDEVIARCEDIGVSSLQLDVYGISPLGRGDLRMRIPYREAASLHARLAAREEEGRMPVYFQLPDRQMTWAEGQHSLCGAGKRYFALQADGEYSLCDRTRGEPFFSIGRFPEQSLQALWTSDRPAEIIHPARGQCDAPCRDCGDLARCRTGCYAMKLLCTKRPYGADPRCPKARGVYADNPFEGR